MSKKIITTIAIILALYTSMGLLTPTANFAHAATATGVTLDSLTDYSGDCGVTPLDTGAGLLFVGAVHGVVADTTDAIGGFGNPEDWFIVIIFDGNGNPIGGTRYGMTLGVHPAPLTSDMGAISLISGFVAPQALPFIAKVYDTDGDKTSVSAVRAFPVLAVSAPFDPSSASSACAALPIGTWNGEEPTIINIDGRLNGIDATSAIYSSDSLGIQVYGIDANSNGYLAANISAEDLETVDCPTEAEGNQLLDASADGRFAIYILTSCEYQINIGPFGSDGKVQVITWTGIPATNIKRSEFFVVPQ